MTARTYTLLGPDGEPYQSATPGALGGHRRARVYGRLDCRAALRAATRRGFAGACTHRTKHARSSRHAIRVDCWYRAGNGYGRPPAHR